MKRRRLLAILAVLVLANLVVGSRVLKMFAETDSKDLAELDLIPQAMSLIRNNYVDPVDTETLVHGALRGMLNSLDIYSQFLRPLDVKGMEVDTTGTFGGLGIEITKRKGFVTVVSPIVGTPAYRAGLMAGDRIVKIDDEALHDPDLQDVVTKLRGEPGTKVTILVVRYDPTVGSDIVKSFTVARAVIKVPSIVEAKILEDSIGYVKLTQFQERTHAELNDALNDLEAQGMDSLILDLRDNPGGLLISAIEVANLFVPGGHVIVSTKGRRPAQNQEFVSQDPGTHPMYPMAVLINNGSASGSEIVAGAIKDLKRGVIIGEKSYGKGSVQTILRLSQGTALRLTTAKYYTPNGTSIQDTGVEPDVLVEVTTEQEMQRRMQKYKVMTEALEAPKKEKPEPETGKPPAETTTPPSPEEEPESLTRKKAEAEEFVDIQLREAVRILRALKAIGADKVFTLTPPKAA